MDLNTIADTVTDTQLSSREDCVLPAMLDNAAETRGEETFIMFDPGGETWSYKETRRQARRTASALSRLGVKRGDSILAWLPNSPEVIRLHLGAAYLGAIFVPINLAYRGGTLEHVIRDSGAKIIVCHSDLMSRLTAEIDISSLQTVVVVGSANVSCEANLKVLPESALSSDDENFIQPSPQIEPWDTHAIVYTSGTTGPSKGVLCTHIHTTVLGRTNLKFCGENDRFLLNLAYFHLAGPLVVFGALAVGASMVVQREFHTKTFWEGIRRTGSTATFLMGSMSTFLLKQPKDPSDTDNPLKAVWQQPLSHDHAEFSRRFGVTIYTQVDMTETAAAIGSGPIPTDRTMPPGYVGTLRDIWPRYEARLVDAFDNEVPIGAVGELIVRCDVPWVITPGYHKRAEATAAVWRNGWFHTGDALRRDAEGSYFFVDRTKDSIRRRGENISSAELESEVLRHEAVADAAAVAVKNEINDEEALIVVAAAPGLIIDPVELTNFLIKRVPHYMVPRYIRVVDKLPYSETSKVQKAKLREQGITPETWDREAAGIIVKREIIGASKQ